LSANDYISSAHIKYDDTGKIVYNKFKLVFLELKNFTKSESEIKSNVDKWMFTLKYLAKLDNLPDALRTKIFQKLFFKAEIAKLSKDNTALSRDNEAKEQRIVELERLLRVNKTVQ